MYSMGGELLCHTGALRALAAARLLARASPPAWRTHSTDASPSASPPPSSILPPNTDRKKLEWYLGKGLAERVSAEGEPLAVRLTFQHTLGDQQAGTSAFYTGARGGCGGQLCSPACRLRARPAPCASPCITTRLPAHLPRQPNRPPAPRSPPAVKKSNRCVACGEEGHYLRFKVVPGGRSCWGAL